MSKVKEGTILTAQIMVKALENKSLSVTDMRMLHLLQHRLDTEGNFVPSRSVMEWLVKLAEETKDDID